MTENEFRRREELIREEAHKLWEAEGRPEGRAERHWDEAKEIVALREGFETTLKPRPQDNGEPVEPTIAFENQAEMPTLDDQGEALPGPTRDAELEIANELPLSSDAEEDARR